MCIRDRVGTLELLSDSERERVKGFVINRFRGDIALLQPGLDWLEARTGKPVLGVLPYVSDLHLEAEDAIDTRQAAKVGPRLKVVVPVLPRISNHTDFDPLRLHPQVELSFVGPGQALPSADLIVLPGSKSVRAEMCIRDRAWTRLPESDDGLEAAACLYYGAERVLPLAGSQAAIQALPRLRRGGRVGVLSPCYACLLYTSSSM